MRTNFAVGRRTDIPFVVLNDRRIGSQIFSLRTPQAILVFLVNESAGQILAVADAATPERNEGPFALLGERTDDGRRTVAAIGGRLNNRESASLFDSLELLPIRLVVVPGSGGDLRVQNHAGRGRRWSDAACT